MRNNKGFGLIELMISSAILIIISLATFQLLAYQAKFMRSVELSTNWQDLSFDVLSTLNHNQTCSTSLAGNNIPSIPSVTLATGTTLSLGSVYEDLRITKLRLLIVSVLSPTQVVAVLNIQAMKTGSFIGSPVLNRNFMAQLQISGSTIVSCF